MIEIITHMIGFSAGATMSFFLLLWLAGKLQIKHQIEIDKMVKENIKLAEIIRNYSEEKEKETGLSLYAMYGEIKSRLEENKGN